MPESLVELTSSIGYGGIVATVGMAGAAIIVYYLRRHVKDNDDKHRMAHDVLFGTNESVGLITSVSSIQQRLTEQERLNERLQKNDETLTDTLIKQNEINSDLKTAVALLNQNTTFLSDWIKAQKEKGND